MTCSIHPDLLIAGRFCCDQAAVRRLAAAGLIVPAERGTVGQRVPAVLAPAAVHLLAA